MSTGVIVGFLAGLAAIGIGVWKILESRRLADTQTVPPGQASAGTDRICVHGRAQAVDGATVTAPVSGEDVLFARAWEHHATRDQRTGGRSRARSGTRPGIGRYQDRGYKHQSRDIATVATRFEIQDLAEPSGGVLVDARTLDTGALEQVAVQPSAEFVEGRSAIGRAADQINSLTQAIDPRAGRPYTETQLLPGQEVWILGSARETKDGLELHEDPKLLLGPPAQAARSDQGIGAFVILVGLVGIGYAIYSLL